MNLVNSSLATPTMGPGTAARRAVAIWLLAVAGMVFAIVVIGGLTRLTESGLSIVSWRPFTGWLPPLGEAAWQEVFSQYQAYPEFQKVNAWMTLADFKGIFWLEFIHRLWGRLIGLVFLLPFLWFLWRGVLDGQLKLKLSGLFVLGGLQGGLGWYMVQSGLVDRPDVSQYRLTAHLALALVIFGLALWMALGLLGGGGMRQHRAFGRGLGLLGLIFLTILSGGLVAGTDAGFAYNTFPLMDGDWLPAGLFAGEPAWLSAFQDPITIQWDHRWLAKLTALAVLAYGAWTAYRGVTPTQARALWLLVGAVALQVSLGVATLLSVVFIPLAAAHQAGAVVLLGAMIFTLHRLSGRA